MHHLMAKFWWILALRGVLGILLGLMAFGTIWGLENQFQSLFGLSALVRPGATLAVLILFLGLYAFVDGVFSVILGAQVYSDGRRWWSLMGEGFLGMGLGILTWLFPGTAALYLLYWIAIWAILTGILEALQGIDLNEYKERRKPFFFAGLCSVVFGLIILYPGMGGTALVWAIGIYAFLFGIPLLVLAFRLHHYAKRFRQTRKQSWKFAFGGR